MNYFLFLNFFAFCFTSHAQAVLFGERELDLNSSELNSSVFFDKNGWIYPSVFIADSSLINSNSCLKNYYKSLNDSSWKNLLQKQELPFIKQDDAGIEVLNDRILNQKKKALISQTASVNSIVFQVHGFRKQFKGAANDYTSEREFSSFKKLALEKGYTQNQLIQIYWDGNYDCCFGTDFQKNKALFRLFESTISNEIAVSQSLAFLIDDYSGKTINLIGHSLGAKLVFDTFCSLKRNVFLGSKKINIVMLAPACGQDDCIKKLKAKEKELLNVGVGLNKNNFTLSIFYNRKDFALRKKDNKLLLFGPGARRYGHTDLGCMKNPNRFFRSFSQSPSIHSLKFINCKALGKNHSHHFYMESEFTTQLFESIEND